jgi:hypothetical protein
MDDDDGENIQSVVVPLSLITILTESLLDVIDQWHEERGMHDLNTVQCIVAMMAAVDAASETLHSYPDGVTIQ